MEQMTAVGCGESSELLRQIKSTRKASKKILGLERDNPTNSYMPGNDHRFIKLQIIGIYVPKPKKQEIKL